MIARSQLIHAPDTVNTQDHCLVAVGLKPSSKIATVPERRTVVR